MRWLVLFFLCFHISIQTSAQQSRNIRGVIKDQQTGEEIPFAHIRVKNSNIGTVANHEGMFQLYLNQPDTVTLKVSSIGYQTAEFRLNAKKSEHVILLREDLIQLPEVVVLSVDYAKELVKNAVKAIPQNYPVGKERLTGFIREVVSSDSLKTVPYYISEAEIEVSKDGYGNRQTDGIVKMIKGRKLISPAMDSLSVRIYAGGHLPHRFDPVIAHEGPLSLKKAENYDFDILDTLMYDGNALYQVYFQDQKRPGFTGELYIAEPSLAIIKVIYQYDRKAVFSFQELLSANERLYLNQETSYEMTDGVWRLSTIGYHTAFLDSRKRKVFLNSNYTTHDFEPETDQVPYPERIQYEDFLFDVLAEYQEDYWDGFNVTTPESVITTYLEQFAPGEEQPPTRFEKFLKVMDRFSFTYLVFVSPSVRSDMVATYQANGIFVDQSVSAQNKIHWGFSNSIFFRLNNHLYLGWNNASTFGDIYYVETGPDLALRFNLTPQRRPVYLVPSLGYRWVLQTAPIGEVQSPGTFREQGKKIDARTINMYAAQQQPSLKPGLSLEIEKSKRLSFYVSGSYLLPISQVSGVYLVEKQPFFRQKQVFVPERGTGVRISNQNPFESNWIFALGFRLGI